MSPKFFSTDAFLFCLLVFPPFPLSIFSLLQPLFGSFLLQVPILNYRSHGNYMRRPWPNLDGKKHIY